MGGILIDLEVDDLSSPEELRKAIADLDALLREHTEAHIRSRIESKIAIVKGWLADATREAKP
jgi:hypothetical protein